MINGSKHHFLFSINGNVKTSGGTGSLTKGEFMIADMSVGGTDGAQAALNIQAAKKNAKIFKILMGEEKRLNLGRSKAFGPSNTFPFSLDQVKDIRVKAPQHLEPKVDELILGYNGHDASTSLSLKVGSNPLNIRVMIQGIPTSYGGGGNNYEVLDLSYPSSQVLPFASCSELDPCTVIPCQDYIYDIVEELRRREMSGGRKWGDVLEITPIVSCATAEIEEEYTYWTLSVCDTGDSVAKALIEAQYPDYPVLRLSRKGSVTTYQILIPEGVTPDDYEYSRISILKTCDACPAGYDTIVGGYVYSITVEDDGTTVAAGLQAAIPNAVAASVVRQGIESGTGTGIYIALTATVLTPANVGTIVAAYPTATVTFVAEKEAFCSDDVVEEIAWVEGDTCGASLEQYRITLPDNDCGETRLAELQAAYPDAAAIRIVNSANSTRTITLTGTSGTANVNITAAAVATDYLATFATNLTTTANNFVTAHAATILSAKGVTVTANAGVFTFSGPNAVIASITITNATTNLAGTLGAVVPIPANGGCMTTYEMDVITNMVCEECDPVFEDYYVSEAPIPYDGVKWALFAEAQEFAGTCYCGIKFKAKLFTVDAGEILRYKYPFIEDSVEIFVTAGYTNGVDLLTSGVDPIEPINVQYINRKQNRDLLGGHLLGLVKEKNVHFQGDTGGWDFVSANMLGLGSDVVDLGAQYVQYSIDIKDENIRQGLSGSDGVTHTYDIFVEYGRHLALEAAINKLASASGNSVVQA